MTKHRVLPIAKRCYNVLWWILIIAHHSITFIHYIVQGAGTKYIAFNAIDLVPAPCIINFCLINKVIHKFFGGQSGHINGFSQPNIFPYIFIGDSKMHFCRVFTNQRSSNWALEKTLSSLTKKSKLWILSTWRICQRYIFFNKRYKMKGMAYYMHFNFLENISLK